MAHLNVVYLRVHFIYVLVPLIPLAVDLAHQRHEVGRLLVDLREPLVQDALALIPHLVPLKAAVDFGHYWLLLWWGFPRL